MLDNYQIIIAIFFIATVCFGGLLTSLYVINIYFIDDHKDAKEMLKNIYGNYIDSDGKKLYTIQFFKGHSREGILYFKNKALSIPHRLDGPAFDYTSGDKHWYVNGHRHRENGPAIEWGDGDKWFFLNGEEYTEEEYWGKIKFGDFV